MVDAELSTTIDAASSYRTWTRVAIEAVQPCVDGGAYAIKRILGEPVVVGAYVHADGHNELAVRLLYRKVDGGEWQESEMSLVLPGLDLWEGQFVPQELGSYEYTVEAWIDQFANLKRDIHKKCAAAVEFTDDLLELTRMLDQLSRNSSAVEQKTLFQYCSSLKNAPDNAVALALLDEPRLHTLVRKIQQLGKVSTLARPLPVTVEPERALYGAWYEAFPRSTADQPEQHGTFKTLHQRLPYIAELGFNVLYLPPIHPIGETHRKGRNNSLKASASDPGSPWAIGSKSGGHMAVHPQLGTLADFETLVTAAKEYKIEIALDIAFQCSPDHPYVREHPEWFYHRVDGTIKYAENPPKKYEDIYPLDFECAAWQSLWDELTNVVLFWVDRGVTMFRVDNPHTKPYAFWEYLISKVKRLHPQVIFLSEAFARPQIMYRLAKVGFSQSYTYFTWRNSKKELTDYFTELYLTSLVDYFRPNLFCNTPDIFPEYLQYGGRAAFIVRLILAATLGASYGIYGPKFELCITDAIPGSEEYNNSEKYEVRHWQLNNPASLRHLIARLNEIRQQNSALQQNRLLRFLEIDNNEMIAFAKSSADGSNTVVVVVNLDPHFPQAGTLKLPSDQFRTERSYQVHDMITGKRFLWSGESNFVRLDPEVSPAFVFRILQKVRSEHDFDYFV